MISTYQFISICFKIVNNDETLDVLKSVPFGRIGHGVYLHPEVGGTQEIVNFVSDNKIPIGK